MKDNVGNVGIDRKYNTLNHKNIIFSDASVNDKSLIIYIFFENLRISSWN